MIAVFRKLYFQFVPSITLLENNKAAYNVTFAFND